MIDQEDYYGNCVNYPGGKEANGVALPPFRYDTELKVGRYCFPSPDQSVDAIK